MKWLKLNRVVKIVIVAIGLTTTTVFAATVPNTLNYQGTLTDSSGNPITATQSVTFKLYTTALGGTPFWSETQNVAVTKGLFSAVLGSTNQLPTALFNGNTYIGLTVENGAEMLPRQKMSSVAYALKAADGIPKGVIVLWSGAQIPEGWALCDGNNGTPNLKDRFVVGAGASYAVGSTGGSVSMDINHTHNDDHNHSGNTDNWINDNGSVENGSGDNVAEDPHYHSFTTNYKSQQGHGNTTQWMNQNTIVNKLPPYYALAYIMKL